MDSRGVHTSPGRVEFMISIWRITGNVCNHRVMHTRAFGVALPAILTWPLPGLANGGRCGPDPNGNAFSDDLQASGRS